MAKKRNSKKFTEDEEREMFDDISKNGSSNSSSTQAILNSTDIYVKCTTENQKKFLKLIDDNDLTVCLGEAGCGKTFLMCYAALKLLKTNPSYKKILLIKPI